MASGGAGIEYHRANRRPGLYTSHIPQISYLPVGRGMLTKTWNFRVWSDRWTACHLAALDDLTGTIPLVKTPYEHSAQVSRRWRWAFRLEVMLPDIESASSEPTQKAAIGQHDASMSPGEWPLRRMRDSIAQRETADLMCEHAATSARQGIAAKRGDCEPAREHDHHDASLSCGAPREVILGRIKRASRPAEE